MRFQLIAILLFGTSVGFGQGWTSTKTKEIKGFKFKYRFNLEFPEDTASLTISENKSDSLSHFIIRDHSGSPLAFTNILFYKNKKIVTGIITTEEGTIEYPVDHGIYNIDIKCTGYDDYKINIAYFFSPKTVSITMKRASSNDYYILYSRKKLSDIKLSEVIDCLKINGNNGICDQSNKISIYSEM